MQLAIMNLDEFPIVVDVIKCSLNFPLKDVKEAQRGHDKCVNVIICVESLLLKGL